MRTRLCQCLKSQKLQALNTTTIGVLLQNETNLFEYTYIVERF